jgi:hypothetical protein
VRVYLPSTLTGLQTALTVGELRSAGGWQPGFAVTDELRAALPDGDVEVWEAEASEAAASASLGSLAADPAAPRCRVVLAADVPDDAVVPDPEAGPAAVRVLVDVPLARVDSALVDDVASDPAAAGPLSWFARQELSALVADRLP